MTSLGMWNDMTSVMGVGCYHLVGIGCHDLIVELASLLEMRLQVMSHVMSL